MDTGIVVGKRDHPCVAPFQATYSFIPRAGFRTPDSHALFNLTLSRLKWGGAQKMDDLDDVYTVLSQIGAVGTTFNLEFNHGLVTKCGEPIICYWFSNLTDSFRAYFRIQCDVRTLSISRSEICQAAKPIKRERIFMAHTVLLNKIYEFHYKRTVSLETHLLNHKNNNGHIKQLSKVSRRWTVKEWRTIRCWSEIHRYVDVSFDWKLENTGHFGASFV